MSGPPPMRPGRNPGAPTTTPPIEDGDEPSHPAGARGAMAAILRRPGARRSLIGVAAFVMVALAWSGVSGTGGGIDPSWQIALHLAARERMHFGDELIFTYGPLGFLLFPQLVTSGTWVAAFLTTVVVKTALVATVIVAARRAFGHWAPAILAGYLVAAFTSDSSQLMGYLGIAVGLLMLQRPVTRPRAGILAAAALGSAAAFVLLTKLSGGIVALALLGAAAGVQGRRGIAPLATFAGAFLATFTVLWTVTGNRLADLADWTSLAASITSGYTGGTMIEDELVDRSWEYPAYLLGAAGLLAAAIVSWRRSHRARLVLLVPVAVFVAWTGFKHGFVRHDAHSVSAFVGLAVLAIVIEWRGRTLRFVGAALALAALTFAANAGYRPATDLLRPEASRFGQNVRLLLDAGRRDEQIAQGRERRRAELVISPRLIDAIGDAPVHVAPYETSLVWAFGLTWQPIPQFQSFSTFTPKLDDVNAAALAGERAPVFVLREEVPRYDSHSPVFESPREMLGYLCRYRHRDVEGRWELLERSVDRCGEPRSLGGVSAAAGDPVTVPDAGPGTIVAARIRWTPPIGERIRSLVHKPGATPEIEMPDLGDGDNFRIPAALLSQPLVMRAPVDDGTPDSLRRLLDVDRFILRGPQRVTVEFVAIPTR